jgi:hypothetical protein
VYSSCSSSEIRRGSLTRKIGLTAEYGYRVKYINRGPTMKKIVWIDRGVKAPMGIDILGDQV